jgi:hypothetical protein
MKKLVMLCLAIALAPATWAKVWTTVYRCDGMTPLEAVDPNHPTVYRDIMVGTRLVLVVSSDKGEYWRGSLQLSPDDAQYAHLSGRGYVKTPANYRDSCLASAGKTAYAIPFSNSWIIAIDLSTSPSMSVLPGDWFVVDYHAEQAGTCHVDLCGSSDVLIETLAFTHVPSRDFNGDAVVNFKDFALLASHSALDADPNSLDTAFDLNSDGRVDLGDLALFSEYWLERTDCGDASHLGSAIQ